MDWLQFISSLIGSLAWPLAAVTLGFMFRAQVRKLLDKMKSLKAPGGIEASFSEDLKAAAAQAVIVEAASLGNVTKFGTPTATQTEPVDVPPPIETHYDSPRWRIMDAYSSLESAMEKIIHLGNLPKHTGSGSAGFYAYTLMKEGVIDDPTRLLIEKLRELRDRALTSEVEPDRQVADTFYVAARAVYRALAMKLHEQILHKEEAMTQR